MAELMRRKPGTRPKGPREPITTRVPTPHHHVFEARAKELGISVSSWVALKLAEVEDLPIPDFVQLDLDKARAKRDNNGQGDLLATG